MQANTQDSAAVENSAQYLTFVLDSEEYAIDILRVQEIKSWSPVTHVPRSPEHMLGVINLRGAIVPVIDLRRRFSCDVKEFTNKTAVVIVRAERDKSEKVMGLVVDRVSEVYHFSNEQIQPSAGITSGIDADFIYGLAQAEEKLVIVLNLDKIVDSDLPENLEPEEASNDQ